ncbi:hypothetical protein [Pseudomonas sp. QD4]|uniref:hypothetical protein n=1 Tax=Pseudomonas sp. QD4 TaxID=3368618 RepID=UPI003BA2C287
MFQRSEFDSLMRIAQNYLDQSDTDPVQLRNALMMMMAAMSKLADSCENDLNNQLKEMAEQNRSAIER